MATSSPRLSVSLTPDDDKLLIGLRHHLETKSDRRWSLAEVIRSAIQCKAEAEGFTPTSKA